MPVRFRELEVRGPVHGERGTYIEEDSFPNTSWKIDAEFMRDASAAVVCADVERCGGVAEMVHDGDAVLGHGAFGV